LPAAGRAGRLRPGQAGEAKMTAGAEKTATEPVLVSHLKFGEAIGVLMQLRAKVEAEWHRIVYIHAALIGVMIFFAGQQNPHVAGRLVVFAFYTLNVLAFYRSLRDAYDGLRLVTADIAQFPPPANGGNITAWLASRSYRHDAAYRAALLAGVWGVVFYLMILPLIVGRTPGVLGPSFQ
jgi:hypothetical protein